MGEAAWRWPVAERFLDTLRAEGKKRLLEIGAGVGYTAQWFAERGIDVVATDLSPAQVELCRAKGLEAHVRDMYDLGFSPASFDAVWAMNCIHHVPTTDLATVLEGIREVLVPGGLFHVGVWGGRDMEGIYDDDFYPPPRFFAIRSDEALHEALASVFTIIEFTTFLPDQERDDDGLHMQSAVLRKP
jgi:cyclopropane fatty-acyl-phospholipid synthase-like methyltransferase